MNYQKLINLKKSRKSMVLFIFTIAFMLTSCQNKQAKVLIATGITPLPITYVTTNESGKRQEWFDRYKYPFLDTLTMNEEGVHETKQLNFNSLDLAIKFFDSLIVHRPNKDSTTGVRVYFASQTLNPGGCGKLTLIFTATAGTKNADVGNYYAFKNEVLDTNILDFKTAKEWVDNYQQKKRVKLSQYTMDSRDTCKEESKHILFSLQQIKSIIAEMQYQKIKHSKIVKGFGIRFASYTDQDYVFLSIKPVKYHKRLTIGFTFIDWENDDIGIKQIDATEFLERLKYTKDHKDTRGDTFDTGVPAPPPSDTKESLD